MVYAHIGTLHTHFVLVDYHLYTVVYNSMPVIVYRVLAYVVCVSYMSQLMPQFRRRVLVLRSHCFDIVIRDSTQITA